ISLTGLTSLQEKAFYGTLAFGAAIQSFLLLVPIVLALIAGGVAGSLRVKSLLPASIVPGWLLLGACSLQALMLFVMFVAINYIANSALLILALLLWLAGVAGYLFCGKSFVRPLTVKESERELALAKWLNLGFAMAGTILFLIFLFTTSVYTGVEGDPLRGV